MKALVANLAALGASALLLSGCETSPLESLATHPREFLPLETLGSVPFPANNARSPERIALGRLLFYDPILSGERDVSCGTCHHPDFGFGDLRPQAAGVSGHGLGPDRLLSQSAISGLPMELTPRNTPTVFNSCMAGAATGDASSDGFMFRDGRVRGLEQQVTAPIRSRVEMRGDAIPGTELEARLNALDTVLARLRGIPKYVSAFEAAFPEEAALSQVGFKALVIDSSTLVRAVAAFERELVTRGSPYDRYVQGDDDALSAEQVQGLFLFHTKARCAECHGGPMLSLYGLVRSGVPPSGPGFPSRSGDDLGLAEATGQPEHRYAFITPTLRNVELTAPYMHNGVFATLEDVVRYYNDGAQPRHHAVSDEMLPEVLRKPLGLSQPEIAAIVAFLRSLTDPGTGLDGELLSVPDSVPSGLPPVVGLAAPASALRAMAAHASAP